MAILPLDKWYWLGIILRNIIFRLNQRLEENAGIMSMTIFSNAFSDELVTATELNHQPGRILDKVKESKKIIKRQR